MRLLALIPARGGSKRFPRKNLLLLAGKPLLQYAVDAATESALFERIVVSSEDDEILSVAKRVGATPLERPASLGSDTVSVPQVCLHTIEQYAAQDEEFDALCILLPTSPLRTSKQIKEAYARFVKSGADVLMSTTTYSHNPFRALVEDKGLLTPYFGNEFLRRDQDVPEVVVHDGAIIFMTVEALQKNGTYYAGKIVGYPMPAGLSVDINVPSDLKYAEFLFKENHGRGKRN